MELGPSTFVGVGLALIGFILYFIKTKKPDVSRDYDLFFSSVGLLCGGILIFQGWRLDPILLLCQILSSATAIFFIGESLWLRGTNSKKFTSIIPSEKKKQAFLTRNPLSINSSKISSKINNTDEFFLYQDSFDKKNFFSEQRDENLDFLQEKEFFPVETHRKKNVNEQNKLPFRNRKKRIYQEKKISMYYQVKKYLDFDYTDPIDYCHLTYSIKD
jgi:hypothetical protein